MQKMLRLLQNLNLLKKKRLQLHRYLWNKPERNLKGNKHTFAKPLINPVTRSYYHLDQLISKDLLLDLPSLLILNSSTSTQINRQSRANTNFHQILEQSFLLLHAKQTIKECQQQSKIKKRLRQNTKLPQQQARLQYQLRGLQLPNKP